MPDPMSDRTDYALAHPAADAAAVLAPELATVTTMPGGNLLRTILTVDR